MLIEDGDVNPERKTFVVHKKEVMNIKFLILEDESPARPCYIVRNHVPNLKLSFMQQH